MVGWRTGFNSSRPFRAGYIFSPPRTGAQSLAGSLRDDSGISADPRGPKPTSFRGATVLSGCTAQPKRLAANLLWNIWPASSFCCGGVTSNSCELRLSRAPRRCDSTRSTGLVPRLLTDPIRIVEPESEGTNDNLPCGHLTASRTDRLRLWYVRFHQRCRFATAGKRFIGGRGAG